MEKRRSLSRFGDAWVESSIPAKSRMEFQRADNLSHGYLFIFRVQSAIEKTKVGRKRCEDHLECREQRRRLSSVEQAPVSVGPEEVERYRAKRVPHVDHNCFTVFPLIADHRFRPKCNKQPRQSRLEEWRNKLANLLPQLRRECTFKEQVLLRLDCVAPVAYTVDDAWVRLL